MGSVSRFKLSLPQCDLSGILNCMSGRLSGFPILYCRYLCTVVPVMNGHPRDQAKVFVHGRWPPIRGTLTLKCVGRGIDNVAVQARWQLTTGVA